MSVKKLGDKIVEDLLAQLGSGRLREGSTIPSETALCADYKVTRGVVREAIRSLDARGFIKVAQGVRSTISPAHEWNILDPIWVSLNSDTSYLGDLHVTREMIEPEIAALAALNATKEDIQELRYLLNQQQSCADDAEALARIDIAWHCALSRATHNRILVHMHNSMVNLGVKTRIETTKFPGAIEEAAHWHEEIIKAIENKDSNLAKATMRVHLSIVQGALEQAISAR